MAKKISKPDMDRIKAAVAATFGGPHRRKKAVGAGVCAAVLVAGLGIACATVAAPPQAEAEVQEEGRIVPVDVVLPSTEDGNRDLSSDAVASRAESLFFDGEAVGIDHGRVSVEASEGHVTVTETSDGDAWAMVEGTAKRGASMAKSLDGMSVDGQEVADVTWVTSDGTGTPQVAATFVPKDAPEAGSVADVINGSAGHAVSDTCFEALGDDKRRVEQAGGTAPVGKDGNPVVAAPAAKEDEKQESQDSEAADQGQQPQAPSDAGQSSGQQGGSAQSGQASGGNKTEKPASSSSSTPSSSTSSNGSSASQKPQKTWVEEKGHYEPTYESVWVPNVQYIRHERWQCSACGSMFSSGDAMDAHVWGTYGDAQHPNGASAIDQSYTEQVDNGRYEQRQTGQKWIVDVPGHWE